jgi:hypothetical protein
MDEGELFKKALHNVAMNKLMEELREAVVTGPKVLSDIYKEYLKLSKEEEKRNG